MILKVIAKHLGIGMIHLFKRWLWVLCGNWEEREQDYLGGSQNLSIRV